MKIDWFTVIAQILNFLILVGLLRYFLYKPILKAIDDREKKIATELADAEAKKAAAKKEQDDFKQKNETFDKGKKGLMDKAVAETQEERKKLMEQARNDAAALRTKMEEALKETQESMNHEIAAKTRNEVFTITRKALNDLASVSLEEQSANMFIQRLKGLKEEEKQPFINAYRSNSNAVIVRSAFAVSERQQNDIRDAINRLLSAAPQIQFKITPELISGIELTSNGYKLAWSITEYINGLEKTIPSKLTEKPEAVTEKA